MRGVASVVVDTTEICEANIRTAPPSGVRKRMAICGAILAANSILGRFVAVGIVHRLPLLVLIWIDPIGPLVADAAANEPQWLYLLAVGGRLLMFMPASYLIGYYGRLYVTTKKPKKSKVPQLSKFERPVRCAVTRVTSPVRRSRCMLAVRAWLGRAAAWINKHFPRYGWLFIILRPNGWMLIAAGATKLSPCVTAAAAIAGTVGWLELIAWTGPHIPHAIFLVLSIF